MIKKTIEPFVRYKQLTILTNSKTVGYTEKFYLFGFILMYSRDVIDDIRIY
jgi:hypothetical protein